MRIHHPSIFLLTLALITGCVKEVKLPPNDTRPVTVIYAELIAGEKPLVHISRSKTVNNSTETRFDTVKNALVQLLNKNGQLQEALPFNAGAPGSMSGGYTGRQRIQHGRKYTVLTTVPGMNPSEGSAEIPYPFQLKLEDTVRTILNGRPTLRFRFNIQARQMPDPQYIVLEALKQTCLTDTLGRDTVFLDEYHRLPCYTQDEKADNNQIGGLNESYSRILFTQNTPELSTYFYVNSSSFNVGPDDLVPKGRVIIYVKSVSKAYYEFLLTYEKIKRNTGLNSLFNAIQLQGNVNGGLGIIGGCTQRVYYLYYDDL